jgi:glucans biosynthesis protein C
MQKQRIVYVDVIKVFLTCIVVAHHAGQAYGPTGGAWPVADSNKTNWLGQFFFINASYMMGLYFFISGYFMLFSLNRKTNAQFMKERLVRLGIPLLVFTFLVFLPFNYSGSAKKINVFSFFVDTYFNKPPIATGHLWFVASLLFYSFVYLLLFRSQNQSANAKSAKPFRVYYLFIYIILLTIISALVRLQYPIDVWRTWLIPVEVAHVPQYLSLFLIGALFNRYQWLDAFKLSTGLFFSGIAIAAYALNQNLPDSIKNYWLTESFLESLLCVGISMGILTLFRHYGNRSTAVIRSLSDNAYGIYLFHLLIVIALQQILLDWVANANIKFAIVTVLGIFFSLCLSALLRKISLIRKVI